MTIFKEVETIVRGFFTVSKGISIDSRTSKGKPFTAIRVDGPHWTAAMHATKGEQLYKKLAALGDKVQTVQSTSGFLVRVQH